ncbi:MAG TPA: squalene synthase HpnC [Dongiaceae bacterium]|jgi:squalene synthase HpnC|nr:squalene synthase HpnC [Dongiaceae bacterium]
MTATVADIATPSGKHAGNENFPVGSALIRADLRPHVHAFYRFARMADDIADNPALAPDDKIRRLDLMEAVLLDADREDIPESADFRRSLAQTHVSPRHGCDLLTAFRMDATKQRYADWGELMTYCRYSASPVGRQLLDLHGENPAGWFASDALCNALQVINHLQDCGVDYLEMDRVYLPLDHLARHGSDVAQLAGKLSSAGLKQAIGQCLDETETLMADARRLPGVLKDFRLRAESATIVRLADRMIGELRRRDPLAERVKPSKRDFLFSGVEGVCWALMGGGKPKRAAA